MATKFTLNVQRKECILPDELNPFEILNINVNASHIETKYAFKKKICSPDRYQRSMSALAYDMICSQDPTKYIRTGNKFIVNKKDHFFYVTTGNFKSLVEQIRKHKYLLNQRDEFGRTLLYLAARNGFYNICDFLLKSGCNVNEIQKDGSTALHAAAFYGHLLIVELLLEYEANPEIRNNFASYPKDEACTTEIKACIQSKTNDKINVLLNNLIKGELAKNMVVIKHDGMIIGKKILRNSKFFLEYSKSYIAENWMLAWHGTKYNSLQSIMRHGLHAAGTVLSAEHRISTQLGHIALNRKVGEYQNWANAIFVSPSIFYAADVTYSERIFSDHKRWCILVETRVKPNSFSKHHQTLLNQRELLPGEPKDLEYRVAVKENEDFIMRVESDRNIIVTALVFVNLTFLENIDEYYQGKDLFANSEAERALFQ
ncbi:unnamed protein product [Didymodactylos carnosus]|uniref:Uncharacterized protein n=1 Tax=Didymodactylos carnosus TaxID=1234261 RepID=A0A814ZA55_9BILA|nr:unnamed protein product [Didymodactylos carnosus]CAF4001720.1 unnamed protein product [Didymodactylos carnosus]